MKIDLRSITPVQPLDVGDTRFEFRVVLALLDDQATIDVTAEQLTDFRQFQRIALAKTGILLDLELAESNSEFETFRRWQQMLHAADWNRTTDPSFESLRPTEPSDDDEPMYGLAEDN